ncbi:hypothetical protein B0O99DRAFT_627094 [Bisporella sp. PMI_857]|nr:hypothetical protein B0O99DRAFT_627094 [Bisporella sp. PMI_857]
MSPPFPFIFVCNLLDRLDDIEHREEWLLRSVARRKKNVAVVEWFGHNCALLDNLDKFQNGAESVLAMLHPADRMSGYTYGFDVETLERVIARAFNVDRKYLLQLQEWRSGSHRRCDLGSCVESLMKKRLAQFRLCAPTQAHKVSVQEVHHCLMQIACHNPESSAAIRSNATNPIFQFDRNARFDRPFCFDTASSLRALYRRLDGCQAKWLTRLLLKDYGPRKLFPEELDLVVSYRLPKCAQQFKSSREQSTIGLLDFSRVFKDVSTLPTSTIMDVNKYITTQRPTRLLSITPNASLGSDLVQKVPQTPSKMSPLAQRLELTNKRELNFTKSSPRMKRNFYSFPVSPPHLPHKVPPKLRYEAGLHETNMQFVHCVGGSRSTLSTKVHTTAEYGISPPQLTSPQDGRDLPEISTTYNTHRPKSLIATSSINPEDRDVIGSVTNKSAKARKRSPLASLDQNARYSFTSRETSTSQDSRNGNMSVKRLKQKSNISIAGTGRCRLTKTKCQLADLIILLSPCIADDPWVANSLLPWHGCRFIKSPKAFAEASLQKSPQAGGECQRIILVDTKRTEQTVTFLKQVQGYKNRFGKDRQWVEVHDWRILEYMAKVDHGKEYTYDPWDRCRMCTI